MFLIDIALSCPVESLVYFLACLNIKFCKKFLGFPVQNDIEFFLYLHCLYAIDGAKIRKSFNISKLLCVFFIKFRKKHVEEKVIHHFMKITGTGYWF